MFLDIIELQNLEKSINFKSVIRLTGTEKFLFAIFCCNSMYVQELNQFRQESLWLYFATNNKKLCKTRENERKQNERKRKKSKENVG